MGDDKEDAGGARFLSSDSEPVSPMVPLLVATNYNWRFARRIGDNGVQGGG